MVAALTRESGKSCFRSECITKRERLACSKEVFNLHMGKKGRYRVDCLALTHGENKRYHATMYCLQLMLSGESLWIKLPFGKFVVFLPFNFTWVS